MSIYFLVSIQAPEGWTAAFGALAGIYALGFVGLVAGYFWARWFSIGLGISGMISGVLSIWQVGPDGMLVFYAASHGIASLVLWGAAMARNFDGQETWRERYHLDEHATHRLGKSVIRVGVSLPYIVLYALAPREGAALTAVAAALLIGGGAYALIKMRTWGLAAMAAGVGVGALSLGDTQSTSFLVSGDTVYALDLVALGVGGLLLAAAAVAPFVGPIARYVVKGDR